MRPLLSAVVALIEEQEELARHWIRDGVANAHRLKDSPESDTDGVPEQVLDNPSDVEVEYILSLLIALTLEIHFNFKDDERAESLLRIGQEARTRIRHRAGLGDTASHAVEKWRPQFVNFTTSVRHIEDDHICTINQIIDDSIEKIQDDGEAVLETTAKEQRTELIERFNHLPEDVCIQDRIADFRQAARLLTLIGNVVDVPLEEGVESAIEYYDDLRIVDLELPD